MSRIALNYLLYPFFYTIHSYEITFFGLYNNNFSNIDNQSKVSGKAFNKFKNRFCKYYPRFSRISRVSEYLSQFHMLFYDYMPRLSQFLKMLMFGNFRMGKNLTSHKIWIFFWQKKTLKMTKLSHACKGYGCSYRVEIWNFFNHELQLKNTEPTIKKVNWGFKFVTSLAVEFKKWKVIMQ